MATTEEIRQHCQARRAELTDLHHRAVGLMTTRGRPDDVTRIQALLTSRLAQVDALEASALARAETVDLETLAASLVEITVTRQL